MSDDDRDLAAGGALGALSDDDRERLEELAAKDSAVARELEAHRATVAALEAGVARTLPPDDLLDRILAEIEPGQPAVAPAREPAVRPVRWWPRLALGGAAAAAMAVLAVVLLVDAGGGPDAQTTVAGSGDFAGVSGEARLYSPSEAAGVLELDLDGLPVPPSGHHYEVWVLRAEGGGAMEAVGSFTPEHDDTRLELPLPGPGSFRAVDVSLEPDGGSPEHSGVSVGGGEFG